MKKYVQIQTTSICNGKCKICPYHTSKVRAGAKLMSDEVFEKTLEQLSGVEIRKLALYMQGDPLTDPKITARARRAYSKLDCEYIELSTNMILLDAKKRHELVALGKDIPLEMWLSFHGTCKPEYQYNMGLSYERQLRKLCHALVDFDSAGIRWAVVSWSENPKASDYWNTLAKALGLQQKPHIIQLGLSNRGGNLETKERIKRPTHKCSRHTDWIHIDVDGNVVMCCDDYQKEVCFGNVFEHNVQKVVSEIPQRVAELAKDESFMCYGCSTPGNLKCELL